MLQNVYINWEKFFEAFLLNVEIVSDKNEADRFICLVWLCGCEPRYVRKKNPMIHILKCSSLGNMPGILRLDIASHNSPRRGERNDTDTHKVRNVTEQPQTGGPHSQEM
jgi:hypothetical protein